MKLVHLGQAATVLACVIVSAAAQAALLPGDFSGKPLVDTASQLAWHGFDSESQGVDAGYRLATGREFQTLLLDGGLALQSPAPIPATWSDEDLQNKASLELLLESAGASEAQRAAAQRELERLSDKYPPLQPDPVAGAAYAGTGVLAVVVPGVHLYNNFNGTVNPERHDNRFAWVREGEQLLLTNVQHNFVPSQCPDDGSGQVRYCGGRSTTLATVGTEGWHRQGNYGLWTEFDQVDGEWLASAQPGFLMVRAVPEPGSFMLALFGLGVASLMVRVRLPGRARARSGSWV